MRIFDFETKLQRRLYIAGSHENIKDKIQIKKGFFRRQKCDFQINKTGKVF